MKRDFKEEYQNYIESDMPDLWSRIEPNLKEKEVIEKEPVVKEAQPPVTEQQTEKKKGSLRVLKMMIPVAAGFCVLLIGVSVMELQNGMKNASTEVSEEPMEEEAAASDEAPMEMEEAAEEAFAEDAAEFSAEMEMSAEGEAEDDAMSDTNGMYQTVEIEGAVLSKIAVAPDQMQERGYVYVYTFNLEDSSSILVYLTEEQCDGLEAQGIEMERQAAYTLSLSPLESEENQENISEKEYFLQKIEKLP